MTSNSGPIAHRVLRFASLPGGWRENTLPAYFWEELQRSHRAREACIAYGRKTRLDLGKRRLFRWRFEQPLWKMWNFKHVSHPLWIFLRDFLRLGKGLAHLNDIDLGKTFGKTCFAV